MAGSATYASRSSCSRSCRIRSRSSPLSRGEVKACVRPMRQTSRLGWIAALTRLESAPLGGFPLKHWAETAAILDRLSELATRGSRAVLATVLRISGSAYRRPGAKLLVEEDGITQGGVSGGGLGAGGRAPALRVLGGAGNRMLHYDTGPDEEEAWGPGLRCEGGVDVYLHSD